MAFTQLAYCQIMPPLKWMEELFNYYDILFLVDVIGFRKCDLCYGSLPLVVIILVVFKYGLKLKTILFTTSDCSPVLKNVPKMQREKGLCRGFGVLGCVVVFSQREFLTQNL